MTKATLGILAAGVMLLALSTSMASSPTPADRPEPSRADRVVKTDAEWQESLSAEEFRILRKAGTERAFTGDYWNDKTPGVFTCGACELELFSSETKFDSGTGWPSYFAPIGDDRVDLHTDVSYGMQRTEVTCARCGGHLGHVFDDGPAPTGKRYCINGNALDKVPLATPAPATKRKR
jgi:peptide-methionine (R)-S-oxide reductase